MSSIVRSFLLPSVLEKGRLSVCVCRHRKEAKEEGTVQLVVISSWMMIGTRT